MTRSPAGFGSEPPLAAPAIHTGMLRSGTKSSPINGAGRARCLQAPGLDFALSRRKQGFESPRERHPDSLSLISQLFLFYLSHRNKKWDNECSSFEL